MLFSWRYRKKKPGIRPARTAGRSWCRPSIEALEDRVLMSASAVTPPVLSNLAAVPVIAIAGLPFSGAAANFSSTESTGLSSTIDWGDGHQTTGNITSSAAQAFQVSGENTYAQPGSYTMVTTITVSSYSVSVTTAAIVLPQSLVFSLNSGTVDDVAGTLIGGGIFVFVPPPGWPAPNGVPAPGAGGLPSTNPQQTPYINPFVGPVRVAFSDQVIWSSLREQGLSIPVAAPTIQIADLAVDFAPPPGQGAAPSPRINMPIPTSPVAMALVTVFTWANTPAGLIQPTQEAAPATSTGIGHAQDASDAQSDAPIPDATKEGYYQPVYLVANRSDLISMSGVPCLPSAAMLLGNASIVISRDPTGERTVEETPPPKSLAILDNNAGTIKRMFQIAAAWIACQVLRLSITRPAPPADPLILNRHSHATGPLPLSNRR